MTNQRLIDTFIDLVKIDSETKFEAKIFTVLKEKFTELGLEVEADQASEQIDHEGNNLICTLKGNIEAPTIYFTCHMDTVTPGKNIQPIVQHDGYITSDGTTILGADDKAGIAVIFEAIQQIKENDIKHGDIQFVITVGEESGLVGAKVIDTSLLKASYGYALDSDGAIGNIVVQAPYQSQIIANITGKSAHAGVEPEKGISAITLAAKSIAKIKTGRIDAETTANIGYFKGGKSTQTNVVVDQVEIVAEARSLVKEKLEKVLTQFETSFNETVNEYGGQLDLQIKMMYPGFKHESDADVVKVAIEAAKELGFTSELLKSGGGSDANIFNGHGIPTANLSVGYENIHTTKERIHTDHMVKLTKFVLEIVKQAAK